MSKTLVKVLGIAATIVGMGATLVSGWVEGKTMDEKIREGIDEALAERENNEEDEES